MDNYKNKFPISEDFLKEEIKLEDSVTVNLILKKFLEDVSYREFISQKFKYKYFQEYDVAKAIILAIKYYKKFSKAPSIEVLKSIVNKSIHDNEKYDRKAILLSIDTALSTAINDEEIIKDSILNIISSRIAYNLIIDNIEKIKNQKDVGYILRELSEIENLTLDTNIGFRYFLNLQEHIEELRNPEARTPTGYATLDKALNGGWYTNGRMIHCFMGCSHIGKSLVLSNLAVESLKQGKFVVVISLEMSEFVCASRIDAHLAGLDINQLQFNTDKLTERVNKFTKLHPNAELVIKEYPTNSINANDLNNYLEKLELKLNRKIDIIYLDYLTLLNPIDIKNKNLYERGAEVSRQVRALSYKFKCPIITAVQAGRESFNSNGIGMENMAESIAIAQIADSIISLYQLEGDAALGLLRMQILKSRLGGHKGEVIPFEIDYKSLRITEQINKDSSKTKSQIQEVTEELDKELNLL